MAMTIDAIIPVDLAQSPKQNLVTLINEANGTDITVEDLTVGSPFVPQGEDETVVGVEVTGVVERGYSGSFTFYYKRLSLSDLAIPAGSELPVAGEPTANNVARTAESLLGAMPNEFKVNDDYEVGDSTVTILPVSDSLLYVGSFTFSIYKALDTIFSEPTLHGFVPNQEMQDAVTNNPDGFGDPEA